MRILDKLEPKSVYYYFEDICNIPHGSKNLDGISSYLEQFAKDRGLFYIRDKSNNVIIVKEATKGYEGVEPVILQGHMDMVAVKRQDCDIDMSKDPLRLKVDGDYVYAEGTSLGGDDGIAVAYILAVLDSDKIKHPRIEAVITTDEEIGMDGATAIDISMLKANRMLNIDSEDEGILLTGCAGGARVDCNIPVNRENKKGIFYSVVLEGLKGGHSGTEIDKERANAIKLIGRALKMAAAEIPIQIAELCGGEKDNAIPIEAHSILYIPLDAEDVFKEKITEIEKILKNEYQSKEKDLSIKCVKLQESEKSVLKVTDSLKILNFLSLLPNGVIAMSADIRGLVETSLNVGTMRLSNERFETGSSVRSSIESAKENLIDQLTTLSNVFGGKVTISGEYPGWQYNPDSKLRNMMVEVYEEMYHEKPKVEAIHAGLECGIMISKKPGLDCVSFGPNIYDIHTTDEKLSISSTKRTWEYLIKILERK